MIRRARLASLLVLLTAATADAQEKRPAWDGVDAWVTLVQLRGASFVGLEALDASERRSHARLLLVLFGPMPKDNPELVRKIVAHVQAQQGSLLLASDRSSMNLVLKHLMVELKSGNYAAANPRSQLHGYADCPLVVPERPFRDLFAGVPRLAFNRPAWFVPPTPPTEWAILAALPEATRSGAVARPCILAHDDPKVVLMSDHSPFINLMIMEEANRRFANNLLDWYQPRQVLFLYDGKPVRPTPLPFGLPELGSQASIRTLDLALRQAEEGGIMRNLEPRTLAVMSALLSIVLAAVAVWILRRPSQSPEVLARSAALLVDFGLGAEGRPEERNLRIPAQEYLFAWWRRYRARHELPPGAERDPALWELRGGSARQRKALHRDLERLAAASVSAAGRLDLAGFRAIIEAARRCDETKEVHVAKSQTPNPKSQ